MNNTETKTKKPIWSRLFGKVRSMVARFFGSKKSAEPKQQATTDQTDQDTNSIKPNETDVERRIKQTGIIIGAFFTTLGASLAYMWTHDGNIDLTIFNEGLSTFENSESLKGFIVSLFEFCKKYWHSFTFIAACCAVPVSIICMIVLICVIKLQTNEARKAQLEYNKTQIKTTNKKLNQDSTIIETTKIAKEYLELKNNQLQMKISRSEDETAILKAEKDAKIAIIQARAKAEIAKIEAEAEVVKAEAAAKIAKLKNDSAVLNTEAEAAITKAKETIDDQS